VKQKKGGEVSLKSDVWFSVGDRGKEREKLRDWKEKERDTAKDVIECAEPKGEREFVVLTVSFRSFVVCFADDTSCSLRDHRLMLQRRELCLRCG